MQTINVKNIQEKQSKDGTKSFFIITDNTGASFSLWEPIGMIKPGCVLEADIEVKGKYANIKDFKITSQPTVTEAPPSQSRPTYGQDSPEKRRSIERQTAATLAFGLAEKEGCTDTVQGYLKIAEQIYQWISQGTIPPQTPTSTPGKQQQLAQKAPAGSGQPPKPDNDPFGDSSPLLTEALKCQTAEKLVALAQKQGKSLENIYLNLGIKTPKDITDLPAAAKVLFG